MVTMMTNRDVHPGEQERWQGLAGSLRVGDLGCSQTGPGPAAARAETWKHTPLCWPGRVLHHAAHVTRARCRPAPTVALNLTPEPWRQVPKFECKSYI